jgi:hypothetical protein
MAHLAVHEAALAQKAMLSRVHVHTCQHMSMICRDCVIVTGSAAASARHTANLAACG